MNQFDVFEEVKALMGQVVGTASALRNTVDDACVPVAFYCVNGMTYQGHDAQTRILAHLAQFEYTPRCEPIDRPYGALCVPGHIEPYVQALNDAKAAFKDYHQTLAVRHGLPVVDANKMIRDAIRACGHDIPNLDAIDRQVIWVDEPVTQCQWYLNESTQNLRKGRDDLLSELDRLTGRYSDSDHVFTIEQLYQDFSLLPENTPVAFRNKKPVQRLSCRITKLDSTHQRKQVSVYAANPMFFRAALVTPVFQKIGEGVNKEGAGQNRQIQSDPIHPVLLPRWYFYRNPTSVKRPPTTGRRKNPYSSTAFEGLWLGVKLRKSGPTAFVQVGVEDVSTSVSINRHGFENAWAKAAAVYAPLVGRNIPEIIRAMPSEEQLRSLLASYTTGH